MDTPTQDHRGTPTRRVILRAGAVLGGAGMAAALAGCGLRWERGSTEPTPASTGTSSTANGGTSPASSPVSATGIAAATRELTAALAYVRAALAVASATPGVTGTTALVGIHRQQADALAARLAAYGAPLPSAPASTPSAPRPVDLAATERAGTDAAVRARLRGLPTADRELLTSVLVQRAGVAASLAPTAVTGVAPGQAAYAPSDALRLLGLARASEYGLEVAAGQVASGQRAAVTALLADMSRHRVGVERQLGSQAPPAAIGYRLPFAVTSPASALRLLRSLVIDAQSALSTGAQAAATDATAWLTLLDWLVQLERWRAAIGLPLTAFPGR